MIRILLDECLPVKLKYRFQEYSVDFQVSTVTDQNWTGIKNGELLNIAQDQFDVFITIDQNLPYQQHLPKYNIAVVALKSISNHYKDLVEYVDTASKMITSAEKGNFYLIESEMD